MTIGEYNPGVGWLVHIFTVAEGGETKKVSFNTFFLRGKKSEGEKAALERNLVLLIIAPVLRSSLIGDVRFDISPPPSLFICSN